MKKLVFALPLLALAACGTTPPTPTFTPLNYSYLPPILLKVSQINVTNSYVPTPSQVATASLDPAPPAITLLNMLKQRLQPAGQPGTGTVTVQAAYVDQVNGMLVGRMVVDLNLASANGLSTGFTEASVSASETAPDSNAPSDMQVALYGLTKRLMTQMNVQLQYQIQRNMPDWISWTNSRAAIPSSADAVAPSDVGVQATPLAAPPGVTTTSAASAQSKQPAALSTPVAAASKQSPGTVPNYLPGAGPTALGSSQN